MELGVIPPHIGEMLDPVTTLCRERMSLAAWFTLANGKACWLPGPLEPLPHPQTTRMEFRTPVAWDNLRLFLRIGAMEGLVGVRLNDSAVGQTSSSWSPMEFEITSLCGDRINTLELLFHPPENGSAPGLTALELIGTEVTRLDKLWIDPGQWQGDRYNFGVRGHWEGEATEVHLEIPSLGFELKSELNMDLHRFNLTTMARCVEMWTPAHPVLYPLTIQLRNQGVLWDSYTEWVGFRENTALVPEEIPSPEPVIAGMEGTLDPMMLQHQILHWKEEGWQEIWLSGNSPGLQALQTFDRLGLRVWLPVAGNRALVAQSNLNERERQDIVENLARHRVDRDGRHVCVAGWWLEPEESAGLYDPVALMETVSKRDAGRRVWSADVLHGG